MSPVLTATHEPAAARPAKSALHAAATSENANPSSGAATARAASATTTTQGPRSGRPADAGRRATDDEILGIASVLQPGAQSRAESDAQRAFDFDATGGEQPSDAEAAAGAREATDEPENLRAVFDANPELRQAWQEANAYRETFATPEDARAATAQLADLDRMDALFFSRRPEDHAELARSIAALDSAAFASLAQAIAQMTSPARTHSGNNAAQPTDTRGATNAQEEIRNPRGETRVDNNAAVPAQREANGPTVAQTEFFHAANAEAVQGVIDAIESQVERLLPEGISKSARNRVVGEIYRELDSTLRSNRQLGRQMRDAFRSGALDADHQRAIVSLVTGRAKQALPGVAKRVLSEWTSTVLAANQDRRARQRAAERRVDIAGSGSAGNDARRSMAPRDVDYARMSDGDILNL